MINENLNKNLTSKISTLFGIKDRNMGVLVDALDLDPTVCFRHLTLRNQDFSGVDLEGWDFEGADLRGANFTAAQNTRLANFKDAKINMKDLEASEDWNAETAQLIRGQSIPALPFDLKTGWFKQYKDREKQLQTANPNVKDFKAVSEGALRSLSLNPSEKFRVLEELPTLSQFQKDALIEVFTNELIKFKDLGKEHPDDVLSLMINNIPNRRVGSVELKRVFDPDDAGFEDLKIKFNDAFKDARFAELRTLVEQCSYLARPVEDETPKPEKVINVEDMIDSNLKYVRQWNENLFPGNLDLLAHVLAHSDENITSLGGKILVRFSEIFAKNLMLMAPISKLVKIVDVLLEAPKLKDNDIKHFLQAADRYIGSHALSDQEAADFGALLERLETRAGFEVIAVRCYMTSAINYSQKKQHAMARDILMRMDMLMMTQLKGSDFTQKNLWNVRANLCELFLVCRQPQQAQELCVQLLNDDFHDDVPPLYRCLIEFIEALASDNLAQLPSLKSAVKLLDTDPEFSWNFYELKTVSNRYGEEDQLSIRDVIKAFEKQKKKAEKLNKNKKTS